MLKVHSNERWEEELSQDFTGPKPGLRPIGTTVNPTLPASAKV